MEKKSDQLYSTFAFLFTFCLKVFCSVRPLIIALILESVFIQDSASVCCMSIVWYFQLLSIDLVSQSMT